MFPTTSPPNVHSNPNQEQHDSQNQPPIQGPLPPALGVGQTHPSSSEPADHLVVNNNKESHEQLPSTATSLGPLHHQEFHPPYQDYMGPSLNTMFSGSHGVTINGQPSFVNSLTVNQQGNPGGSQGLENLKQFVSFEALHDSNTLDIDREVHPVIRAKTMKQLQDWTDNPDATEQIAWLHGPASIGKTAIALDIARQNKVVATFFFSRLEPSHSDGNRLLPTLAWQLARSIPEINNHIADAIVKYPELLNKRLDEQFEYLVAQPFEKVTPLPQPSTPVVIIDGIDECADTRLQRKLLKVIGNAILDRRVPLRFVICSRTDAQIQTFLDESRCPIFSIDLAKFDPAEEIRKREEEIRKKEEELKKREEVFGLRALDSHERGLLALLQEELEKREKEILELRELESRGRQQLARVQEERRHREEELKKREKEVLELRELESRGRQQLARVQEEQRQREEELKKRDQEVTTRQRELEYKGQQTERRLKQYQHLVALVAALLSFSFSYYLFSSLFLYSSSSLSLLFLSLVLFLFLLLFLLFLIFCVIEIFKSFGNYSLSSDLVALVAVFLAFSFSYYLVSLFPFYSSLSFLSFLLVILLVILFLFALIISIVIQLFQLFGIRSTPSSSGNACTIQPQECERVD